MTNLIFYLKKRTTIGHFLEVKALLASCEAPDQAEGSSHQSNGLAFKSNISAQENQLHQRQLNCPGLQYGFATNIKFSEDLLCHRRKKMRVARASILSKVQLLGLSSEPAGNVVLSFTPRK